MPTLAAARRNSRHYGLLLRIGVRSHAVYRLDFWLLILAVVVLNVVDLVLLGVLLKNFVSLGGWSMWQVVFLYCLYLTAMGLQNLFTIHLANIENYVKDGTLDQMLIRPVSPLVQLLAKEVSYKDVAHILLGLAGMAISSRELSVDWSASRVAMCAVAVVGGAVLLAGIVLTLCSLAFWTVESKVFLYGTLQIQEIVQHYPARVFGAWFLGIVSLLLPFAFVNFYPAAYVLGTPIAPVPHWAMFLSPVVGVLALAVGARVWKAGLRRYRSSGN